MSSTRDYHSLGFVLRFSSCLGYAWDWTGRMVWTLEAGQKPDLRLRSKGPRQQPA